MKIAKIYLIIIGLISIGSGLHGIHYNSYTFFVNYPNYPDAPYFYSSFYIMSFICIACYISLLFCGAHFLFLRTKVIKIFVGTMIVEIIYLLANVLLPLMAMWLFPKLGHSIAGATGVAGGGMVTQIDILFPVWAPFVAIWASKRIKDRKSNPNMAKAEELA